MKDVVSAFCVSMPKMPREINETVLSAGVRDTIDTIERARALVDGVIEPVVTLDAVLTMCQGLNGAMREDKRIKKAARGFEDFCVFFAQNTETACRYLGVSSPIDRLFAQI